MPLQHRNPQNLLRALAILGVFAHHVQHYMGIQIPYLGEFGGLLGVQLFFILSGYLIVQTAAQRTASGFWVNRAFRVFPAYWVAVLIISIWPRNLFPGMQAADSPYLITNLLMLSYFSPYAMARFDVLTVSWTLAIEWTWYLLVPGLLWLAQRLTARRTATPAFWATALVLSVAVSYTWNRLSYTGLLDAWYLPELQKTGTLTMTDGLRTAFIAYTAPAQWMFFLLGSLLWSARQTLAKAPALLWALPTLLLAQPGLLGSWWGVGPTPFTGMGLAAFFLLVSQIPAAINSSPVARFIHWLGDLSYTIYLVHVPAIQIVQNQAELKGLTALAASAVLTLAAAALLHYAIENPCRRAGTKWYRARTQPTPNL